MMSCPLDGIDFWLMECEAHFTLFFEISSLNDFVCDGFYFSTHAFFKEK
jgi:hypothetical protein